MSVKKRMKIKINPINVKNLFLSFDLFLLAKATKNKIIKKLLFIFHIKNGIILK
ncbi:hypothetical protein HMPREF3222_01726 [Clostridium perfringens]|uniref:Uncharacterized protein n=1 Tax=Clostridium perfringens TaxID=1502 RepID=A0A133N576_CLOPF|nr:hypothetical protein HMPREF3222_01726 [Clostridium perfringens]